MTVALVTGGGRGLGRTIARELSRAGWQVVVTGRTASSLDDAVASGDAALAVPGDATDPDHVARAVDAAGSLGELQLVVANAGVFTSAGALWEADPATWWRDVEINLRGPLLVLHAALRGMVPRGRGRVVVIGSGYGVEGLAYASAYSTAKTAVMRLVESVAAELEGTGVSVFTISPGLVATDMTEFPEPFLAHHPEMRGRARREGRAPEECARLVLALASGVHDALSGRYVHVRDDVRGIEPMADEGRLRLVPWENPTA